MSAMTHHDAQGFEDVEFAHGTGAVFVQPRIHAHLMEDMSAGDRDTLRHVGRLPSAKAWGTDSFRCGLGFGLTCRAESGPRR